MDRLSQEQMAAEAVETASAGTEAEGALKVGYMRTSSSALKTTILLGLFLGLE